jgi:hypothetical protein
VEVVSRLNVLVLKVVGTGVEDVAIGPPLLDGVGKLNEYGASVVELLVIGGADDVDRIGKVPLELLTGPDIEIVGNVKE